MAIEKRTRVEQIEITESGHIQIRLAVDIVEDDKIIDSKWHRTAVEPGGDVDAQIGFVNVHLASMGNASVPPEGVERVKAHAATAWTPDILKAHKDKVADRVALKKPKGV